MEGDLTKDERAELEQLRKDKEAKDKMDGCSLKVSQKGAVSLYGLGRFPVTLYKEQWEKCLKMAGSITAFIEENEDSLKVKDSTKDTQKGEA